MNSQPLLPIFTETMAELAWRYGPGDLPHYVVGHTWIFHDGSAIRRWYVDNPRSFQHTMERFRDRLGIDRERGISEVVDWSAA